MAPRYLTDYVLAHWYVSTSSESSISHHYSDLVIPRVRLVTYCSRAFSVAGPVCWKDLPYYLKSPDLLFNCFKRQLKTIYSLLATSSIN